MGSYQDAPRGKLISVDGTGHASVVVPEGPDWAIDGVAAIKGGFLLAEVNGPDWRMRQFDAGGKPVRTLPLPASGIGINAIASNEDSARRAHRLFRLVRALALDEIRCRQRQPHARYSR